MRIDDLPLYDLHLGDCLATLRTLPDHSVDAIVTDPPYGLSFMGKRWDYDVPGTDVWAECLRVLKPGGHLLAFAGTRTQHRMAVRIEDGGFEIRDLIAWVYGSGFPKSLDVSKAIDKAAGAEREVVGLKTYGDGQTYEGGAASGRAGGGIMGQAVARGPNVETVPATEAAQQWQGWGTALKPALEPITVARKPLAGTVAANVLEFGTGALNVDGCRVETADSLNGGTYCGATNANTSDGWRMANATREFVQPTGRWPANLIHDGSDEVLAAFPQAAGQQGPISSTAPSAKTSNVYGAVRREGEPSADSDNTGAVGFKMKPGARRIDSGSAARFFYCAKASAKDRGEDNTHPTVKPTDLMRYLCRLVTPPGGLVLDPFMGSGSTGKAAVLEGFRFVGCELSAEYLAIAQQRIGAALWGDLA